MAKLKFGEQLGYALGDAVWVFGQSTFMGVGHVTKARPLNGKVGTVAYEITSNAGPVMDGLGHEGLRPASRLEDERDKMRVVRARAQEAELLAGARSAEQARQELARLHRASRQSAKVTHAEAIAEFTAFLRTRLLPLPEVERGALWTELNALLHNLPEPA